MRFMKPEEKKAAAGIKPGTHKLKLKKNTGPFVCLIVDLNVLYERDIFNLHNIDSLLDMSDLFMENNN